jgi:hypothetical protein
MISQGQTCVNTPILDTLRLPRNPHPIPGQRSRRAQPRERTRVEHALAHVGHWQGRSARYRGTRKNLSGLRRATVVHNLHVIARQPAA